ncbi:sigma-E factor regulatory protein RseB domain-containing protein [Ammoniphilus sp. 3BR4]|uniref:sigma-E factor regulatory protein RseB domain-containing protein n=1 Tax=Ammoniphilus sp. 3BR4 TaxID=3158265 RepID=UPI003466C1FB
MKTNIFKLKKLVLLVGVLGLMNSVITGCSQNEKASADELSPIEQGNIDLRSKMWDSIDYYQTLKGSFKTSSKRLGGNEQIVEFQVREGSIPSSYVKINNGNGIVMEQQFDGQYLVNKENGQVIMVTQAQQYNYDKPKQRFDERGWWGKQKVYNKRFDPAHVGFAEMVTFPQDVAMGVMEDTSKWSITGSETLLGRTAKIVEGELPASYQQKHGATSFKAWVDSQTGVLLKFQEYDENGKVMENMEVTEIEFDSQLETSSFFIPNDLIKFYGSEYHKR